VLAIKTIAPKVRVSAEIIDRNNLPHLRRAKVDDVIVRGEYSGFFLASSILAPGLPQVMQELMSYGNKMQMVRRPIPGEYVGRQFRQLATHFRSQRNALLIGILSETKSLDLDEVLAGDTSAIDQFIKQKFAEAGEAEGSERVKVELAPPDDYVIQKQDVAVLISPEQE